jgi:hypothetical protein
MQSWLNSYNKILKFIQEHPEVEIERSSVIIPEETRSEFYRLFDAVRQSIVRDILDDSLLQAENLSKKFLSAEKAVCALLKLEKVELSNPLGWFLRDPVEGLMRELFDPLFDLLKGKLEPEGFAAYVTFPLRAILRTFLHHGYDKWLVLSLISLLQSDELLRVDVRRPVEHREWTIIRSNSASEIIPEPQVSGYISLVHFPENLLNVPDAIVHSKNLGSYVALRGGLSNAIATALRPSDKRLWISLPETLYSESSPLLLYTGTSPGEISLVADVKKISQPDMMVITSTIAQNSPDGFERAMFWHDLLRPIKGTYIVGTAMTWNSLLPDGIKYVEVGLEAEKLMPVIDSLKDC